MVEPLLSLQKNKYLAAWGVLCLCVVGCGLKPASLSGVVSYEGEPVESGFMRLFPIEETPGDGASVDITEGKYSLSADAGLVAGTYRVAIMASRATGREIKVEEPMPGDPAVVMETVQYLPEKFNSRTELQVTIEPGVNREDFVLTSS